MSEWSKNLNDALQTSSDDGTLSRAFRDGFAATRIARQDSNTSERFDLAFDTIDSLVWCEYPPHPDDELTVDARVLMAAWRELVLLRDARIELREVIERERGHDPAPDSYAGGFIAGSVYAIDILTNGVESE